MYLSAKVGNEMDGLDTSVSTLPQASVDSRINICLEEGSWVLTGVHAISISFVT